MTGTCNKSKIGKFGFQINDIGTNANGTFNLYVDYIKFNKNSTPFIITTNYIDDAQTVPVNVSYKFSLKKSTTVINTSSKSIFFIDDYTKNMSAKYVNYTANLTAYVTNTMDILEDYDFNYSEPNIIERAAFISAVDDMGQGNLNTAAINASLFNYKVYNWTDTSSNNNYYALKTTTESGNKGWGFVLYNPSFESNLIIICPHAGDDLYTEDICISAFIETNAKWLFMATTERSNTYNFIAESGEFFNTHHPMQLAYQNIITDEDVFEIHGYSLTYHPNYPSVVMSNGVGDVNQNMTDFGTILSLNSDYNLTMEIYNLTVCSSIYTDNYCLNTLGYSSASYYYLWDLKNVYSQYGQYARLAGNLFFSTELSNTLRYSSIYRQDYIDSVRDLYLGNGGNVKQTSNKHYDAQVQENTQVSWYVYFDNDIALNIKNVTFNTLNTNYSTVKSIGSDTYYTASFYTSSVNIDSVTIGYYIIELTDNTTIIQDAFSYMILDFDYSDTATEEGITNIRDVIFAAFLILSVVIVALVSIAIISVFSSNLQISDLFVVLVTIISLAIVLLVGYVIISNVSDVLVFFN
jgi:hypothetical protein